MIEITKKLFFRLISPIFVVTVIMIVALYFFNLEPLIDITNQKIDSDLLRQTEGIFYICSKALSSLIEEGVSENLIKVRIKQLEVLEEIEIGVRREDYKIIIINSEGKILLQVGFQGLSSNRDVIKSLNLDRDYHIKKISFDPWQWEIIIIKDKEIYSPFFREIYVTYVIIVLMVILSSLLLYLSMVMNIYKPIKAIVDAVKNDKIPSYKGITEFELLSDALVEANSIKMHTINVLEDMNKRLNEKTEQLNELNTNLEKRVQEEIMVHRKKDSLLYHQSRLAAMGEMISAIAHQWRQPLNNLGLIVQDIRDTYNYGMLNSNYLDDMIKNTFSVIDFMSKTIDDFMCFLSPSDVKTEFDCKVAAHETIKIFLPQFRANNIKISINCLLHNRTFTHLEDVIMCEGMLIKGEVNHYKQVLINLLSNSKDAILENIKKGNIREGFISLDFNRVEDKIIMSLTDNGGGISEEIIDKIFDPYFTTKQNKGTGIGLYIAKTIIQERFNGDIGVKNIKNGSRFEIVLNVNEAGEIK